MVLVLEGVCNLHLAISRRAREYAEILNPEI